SAVTLDVLHVRRDRAYFLGVARGLRLIAFCRRTHCRPDELDADDACLVRGCRWSPRIGAEVVAPGRVNVAGEYDVVADVALAQDFEQSLARRRIAVPLVGIANRLALSAAELRHHHLLAENAPRSLAVLRIAQLAREPRFLIEAEHRAFRIGELRVCRWDVRLARLEGNLLVAAVQPRVEHQEVGEIAEFEAPVDVGVARRAG